VATLAAPIRAVQALVGPGWPADATDPVAILRGARDTLDDVAAAARRTWSQTDVGWTGAGADGAAGFMARTVAAIDELAAHTGQLTSAASAATAAVARARARLHDIVDGFEARAAALEPHLESPGVAERLMAEAQRSLAEAVGVVEELEAELDGKAATLSAPPSPPTPAQTTPAGLSSPSSLGSGLGSGAAPSGASSGIAGSGFGGLAELLRPHDAAPTPEAAIFGDGVAIRLPDGSTAIAPNPTAASAVRHALTQLGVPYDWGGTTPGVGLDCSGLTQWAYHEAGLNIPRLAQEQDIGAAVDAGGLRPGDLAVWDGHVAMIVGNGQMIEAGDPVQLSPIRTTNAGQGFQGFWRPTA
jgi:cell wall-associated NlpC family hydrolase